MKRILLTVVGVLVLAIVIVLVMAASKPDTYVVSRSIEIATTPDAPFAKINDLKKFNEWNPWMKADPNAKLNYSGPSEGPNSSYSWESTVTGAGEMTISESRPNEAVVYDMHFKKPFDGKAKASFSLVPQGELTKVTWSMEGQQKFLGKIIHVFMDMNQMIGGEFEKGLADLKAQIERKE
ncbi:MAG: SRPBCC family protein [Bdellovibrionota bacterium]